MSAFVSLRMPAALLRLVLAVLLVTLWNAPPASANAAAHAKIRQSLVSLKAEGVAASGPLQGQRVHDEATGVFISDDGLILTTYHLLSALENVDGQTVRISANPKEKSETPRFTNVTIMNAAPLLDLLLLKIPPSEGIVGAELASEAGLDVGDVFYTSGFPATADYITDEGHLMSRSGPRGHLWTVSTSFASGQSGSPIYDENARIIGIVKGNHVEAPNQNFIIPIQFADPLIAHLRLFQVQKELLQINGILTSPPTNPHLLSKRLGDLETNIDVLRKHIEWSGGFTADGRVRISYSKLIAGEPQIAAIEYTLTPQYSNRTGLPLYITSLPQRTQAKVSGTAADAWGNFDLTGVDAAIDGLRTIYDVPRFDRIKVSLVPVLPDGTKLPGPPDIFFSDKD